VSYIQNAPPKLRPYLDLGVDIGTEGDKVQGDCPLCGKPRKFGVITETGQFSCFVCSQTGNIYTFLGLFLEQALSTTYEDDLANLATKRGLTPEGLARFSVCKNPLTDEWMVPSYNAEGKLNNLYRIIPVGPAAVSKSGSGRSSQKYVLRSLSELKVGLFGKDLIPEGCINVKVLEGLWDGIAVWEYLQTAEQLDRDSTGLQVIPGAGNYQADWLSQLANMTADFCFDNDWPVLDDEGRVRLVKGSTVRPGWNGMQRCAKLIAELPADKDRPTVVRCLRWDRILEAVPSADLSPLPFQQTANDETELLAKHDGPGHTRYLPNGFDMRDLITHGTAGWLVHQQLLTELVVPPPKKGRGVVEATVPKVTPIPCTSFAELCGHYDQALHFTQDLQDTLAVMLSVVFSTVLPEEQLWFRIIGPPGSGKSTLAEAISAAREYVKPISLLTGFHSGYIEYDDKTGKKRADASPLRKLMDMCLMTKDADTFVNSPNRDRILGEARDLFDGTARSQYRNKVADEFEGLRMSWIMCGTNSLRALNRTFLGERFLDCEIIGKTTDTSPFVQRAIKNTYASLAGALALPVKGAEDADHVRPDRLLKLKQVTYGFLQHLKSNKNPVVPTMPDGLATQIEAHGNYLVHMRARVEREGLDLAYRPVLELPTRLASQVVKLSFCLAIVLGKHVIDEEVFRIVSKVVHNSAVGFQQEVTKVIADSPDGIPVIRLIHELQLPETSTRRLLTDLQEFNIVQRKAKSNGTGQRGRDIHIWTLTPQMRSLWDIVWPKAEQPPRLGPQRLKDQLTPQPQAQPAQRKEIPRGRTTDTKPNVHRRPAPRPVNRKIAEATNGQGASTHGSGRQRSGGGTIKNRKPGHSASNNRNRAHRKAAQRKPGKAKAKAKHRG
jgi:hypothetical protein